LPAGQQLPAGIRIVTSSAGGTLTTAGAAQSGQRLVILQQGAGQQQQIRVANPAAPAAAAAEKDVPQLDGDFDDEDEAGQLNEQPSTTESADDAALTDEPEGQNPVPGPSSEQNASDSVAADAPEAAAAVDDAANAVPVSLNEVTDAPQELMDTEDSKPEVDAAPAPVEAPAELQQPQAAPSDQSEFPPESLNSNASASAATSSAAVTLSSLSSQPSAPSSGIESSLLTSASQFKISVDMPGFAPPEQMCADDPEPDGPESPLSDVPADLFNPVSSAAAAAVIAPIIAASPAASVSSLITAPSVTAAASVPSLTPSSTAGNAALDSNDLLATLATAAAAASSSDVNHSSSSSVTRVNGSVTAPTATVRPVAAVAPTSQTNQYQTLQNQHQYHQQAAAASDSKENILSVASSAASASGPSSASLMGKKSNQWYDVAVVKTNSTIVSCYHVDNSGTRDQEHALIDSNNLPNLLSNTIRVELEPGTAYKLRVAAVNSCGRGPWSDVSAFKTCLPGFPGAPSSIRITKSNEGAHLSWEPPQFSAGEIMEYSVYLAVKPGITGTTAAAGTATSGGNQLAFVRVYCGKAPACNVLNPSLANAHIDTTTKAAIIFRIAAKNEKGLYFIRHHVSRNVFSSFSLTHRIWSSDSGQVAAGYCKLCCPCCCWCIKCCKSCHKAIRCTG
jgi:host cell factor